MIDTEEEKQNYLRENILDKGYEAEEFVSYLTSKKGEEGVNLNNWSLEELKSVVQEYIKNNPINNKIENDNNIQLVNDTENETDTFLAYATGTVSVSFSVSLTKTTLGVSSFLLKSLILDLNPLQ